MARMISFNENNKNHLKAFKYFAYDAGHPEYLVKGNVSDFDFDFRDLIKKKFRLSQFFIDDPNGSFHKLQSRKENIANFDIFYGYIDKNGNDHELPFTLTGKLLYDEKREKVVLEPDLKSIKRLNYGKNDY